MQVALYLPSDVPEFRPNQEQLALLAGRIAPSKLRVASDEAEFFALLPKARAAVVWAFEANWYARAPELEFVFTPSAGRERIEADPSGRASAFFGTFHGHVMAESLVGMISFMSRRFGVALAAQARAEWDRAPYFGTRRLHGQTVLLVGHGAIGQHCAALLSGLGMRVFGVRRGPTSPGAERSFTPEQLGEALALADHVVSLLPGDASTRGFFGPGAFANMKSSAYFYNLGRGITVDEAALVQALENGTIAGAFLDVVAEEPLPSESALWRTKNLYITPHCSAIAAEYLDLYFDELAPLLRAAASGAPRVTP